MVAPSLIIPIIIIIAAVHAVVPNGGSIVTPFALAAVGVFLAALEDCGVRGVDFQGAGDGY